MSKHEAIVWCWKCHKFVMLEFTRVDVPHKLHWKGQCQCGTDNFIERPSWDQEERKREQRR